MLLFVQAFYAIEQKNEEILCVIKQCPHDLEHAVYKKVLLLSIAIFQPSIAMPHAMLNMQPVLH